MAKVQGHCDPRFEGVSKLLQKFVETGEECGAAVAVNVDGKDVVDIWAGYKDETKTAAWEKDTICCIWSTTKTVTSLAGLMLIDRGLIEPNTKVAKVWPEFANGGKENIEFRHLMSHTAGLSGWQEKLSLSDAFDISKSTPMLVVQAPLWEPGTASGYQAITHGHLIGEVVRRTTGQSLKSFVADEIAKPLGTDFQIGCKQSDWARLATIIPSAAGHRTAPEQNSVMAKTFTNPLLGSIDANAIDFRLADSGASNGHTNARALTKTLSVISLGGEVDGVHLLRPETIEKIFDVQACGTDLVMGKVVRWGIGYGLTGKDTGFGWLPEGKICFWLGNGGSIAIMDLDRRMTMSYTMNKLSPGGTGSKRTQAFVKAVYAAVGVSDQGGLGVKI